MKKNLLPGLFVLALLTLASCSKDNGNNPNPPVVTTSGLYVLNEGTFNMNNTTLTYYDLNSSIATTDFFATANGSGLGDTGNDLLIYGGKMYIVVNVSSYVEVADATTAKHIAHIDFKTASSAPRQPRYLAAYKNKVLVSSYDGTVAVIDTSALSIDKFITVGANPEQLVVSGDKLYVANSGGLNAVMDSTVSVVDLNSFTETQKIVVGLNPGAVTADSSGNVYVGCTGDYASVGPKLVKISTATNTVTKSADTAVAKIRFYNGKLYATGGYLGSPHVRVLSTDDFSAAGSNFVSDGTVIQQPYGLNIDPSTGNVYVGDAVDYTSSGVVYCFDQDGKKKFSFSVSPGIGPNTIAFLRK